MTVTIRIFLFSVVILILISQETKVWQTLPAGPEKCKAVCF